MSHIPPILKGEQIFAPLFHEDHSYSDELSKEILVDNLSRECAAFVLDEPSLLTVSWKAHGSHGRGVRAPIIGKENSASSCIRRCRGTGVFLPRTEIINKRNVVLPTHATRCMPRKGTGVFLVAPAPQNDQMNICGKNGEKMEMISNGIDTLIKNESIQISYGICLPQEWPY